MGRAILDGGDERFSGGAQGIVDGARAVLDRGNQRIAGVFQQVVDALSAIRDRIDEHRPGLVERLVDGPRRLVEPVRNGSADSLDLAGDGLPALRDLGDERGAAVRDGAGHVEAGRRDLVVDAFSRDGQAIDEFAGAGRDLLDHLLAGARERLGDLLAPLVEQGADAAAGVIHRVGDAAGGHLHVGREVLVCAHDGGAQRGGIVVDRVTLVGELIQEHADLELVLGVGAFELRNLAVNQRLQLAGARHRPLDAVAHRRDFAADRLTQREDGIGSDRLRLGEAGGGLGHDAGRIAHFGRPPDKTCDREHQHHRQQGCHGDRHHGRRIDRSEIAARGLDAGVMGVENVVADGSQPADGQQDGEPERPTRGPHLQTLQRGGRAAVIVGGRTRRRQRGRGAWLIGGRRRRQRRGRRGRGQRVGSDRGVEIGHLRLRQARLRG